MRRRITIEEWSPPTRLSGKIDSVFPEAKKYVEISHVSQDGFSVRARNFVGSFNLSENTILNIIPKVPIEDIFYLIYRSRGESRPPILVDQEFPHVFVNLDQKDADYLGFLEFVTASFTILLEQAFHLGILRKPKSIIHKDSFRGKLLTRETSLEWLKGRRHELVCRHYEMSKDNQENAILYQALEVLIQLHSENMSDSLSRSLFRSYRGLRFFHPNFKYDIQEIKESIRNRSLPNLRSYYYDLLEIAIFIVEYSTLELNIEGSVKVHSFVVDMDTVFEGYITQILKDLVPRGGHEVLVKERKPLFVEEPKREVEPDIVFVQQDLTKAVLDVKYMKRIKSKEFFQLITYMALFDVDLGIIVHPKSENEQVSTRTFLSKKIVIYPYDLTNVKEEENIFSEEVIRELNLL